MRSCSKPGPSRRPTRGAVKDFRVIPGYTKKHVLKGFGKLKNVLRRILRGLFTLNAEDFNTVEDTFGLTYSFFFGTISASSRVVN